MRLLERLVRTGRREQAFAGYTDTNGELAMTLSLISSLRTPTPVSAPGAGRSPQEPRGDVPLDVLDIRDAVIGDGVILHKAADGELVLHTVTAGRACSLGRFGSAREAWQAIDALDLAEADDVGQADDVAQADCLEPTRGGEVFGLLGTLRAFSRRAA
jgi:hypothetical protein